MPEVKTLKELKGEKYGNTRCLVQCDDQYFVVSSILCAPDHHGPETLAFASDEHGEVSSYQDLAGGPGMTREEVIAELAQYGPRPLCDRVDSGELLRRGLDAFGVVANPDNWSW